jgi:hypothetical protein
MRAPAKWVVVGTTAAVAGFAAASGISGAARDIQPNDPVWVEEVARPVSADDPGRHPRVSADDPGRHPRVSADDPGRHPRVSADDLGKHFGYGDSLDSPGESPQDSADSPPGDDHADSADSDS